jgi:membrane-bound ClpP family serine protease
MGLIISLIVIGMVLMLTEIMLIPGVGVAGILGFLSIGGACYLAFCEFGTMTGIIVLASNAIVLVLLLIWVLRAQTWKKFTLNTNIDSKAVSTETVIAIGDFAKTVTRLAPIGSIRFNNKVMEAKALEGMIDSGVDVEVVLIEDNKIYVSPVNRINN